ncbi:hypothetical protein RND81_04G235500 [Saponaria officinalis]|uniref:DNA polymerase delta subunit 4 n=1 Tax=Saponaria officinalis TaxID=3572 RepID=A0AAW1LQ72_SAPOF
MATPRVNMKEFYKQQKKGISGISKSKGRVNTKTPPSARYDVVPPSSLSNHDEYDATEEMLRQFDLNIAYGPCIGMPRLDRWNRAYKLGMNPPKEIETLLKSGKVQADSLWDGRV